MAKKKLIEISPQKPMKDLDADAFVHGDLPEEAESRPSAVKHPPRPAAQSPTGSKKLPRGARKRKDGTVVRQLTIYLDVDLAKRVAIYCAEHDMETSEVIAKGLRLVVKT